MRIWKNIDGYNGVYQISNDGLIRNVKRNRIRKPRLDPKGYYFVILHDNGIRHHVSIHRAMAIAFIPNPKNYPMINHKNGIKQDNRIENLEWCTAAMNTKHAVDTGLMPVTRNKPVMARNKTTNEKLFFVSGRAAGRFFKTSGVSVGDWIKGIKSKSERIREYEFKYVEPPEDVCLIH